ncbi:Gldg family protein [Pseudomonas sp. B6002]|uniref:Gldg family protein n=1 Tax=Pseudomonas sp. B6002 TaxID=2726978 RepID=UPI0015A28F53|nr:Gldg family protein [Pseudomonas sp. B6002]NVZ53260.1 Gldg family protein [Pseudomonas sp. B6002]
MHSTLRSGATLIVILLLFLAFNLVWIGKIPNIRWDFSQQKIHTLSPAARHLVTTLEDPVDLYYFNAQRHEKTNNDEKRYRLRVEDLLKEYEKASSGRINLHIIHPAPYSEDAYKAALFGLDERHGFFGLIGTRAGHAAQRIEAFNSDNEALLEYEIGDLLHKLSNPERRSVGLLSGSPIDRSSGRLLAQLTRHFDLKELAPRLERVPQTLKTLMVAHPENLPEKALYAIDQFVLGGGKLLMFTDPMGNTPSNAMASRVSSMLTGWGVHMQIGGTVPDKTLASPTHLTLSRKMTNVNDISSENINTLTVSSNGALSRAEKSRTLFTPLLHSSAYSTVVKVGGNTPIEEAPARVQRAVIAARIEGPAYSAFLDGVERQPTGLQKASQIHAVVVADVDMLSDALNNPSTNDNTQFVLNILDNLATPAALADIRPRRLADHSLHVLEAMRADAAKAYQDKAGELERRLERTEREWQLLHPQAMLLDPQSIDTGIQLQALNKERLRLPMELHSLKVEAYAQVQRLVLIIKLTLIAAVPLVLCLIAWVLFLYQNRRRTLPREAFD